MYVEKDGMNAACGKLDAALGGANYLGIHTFGEQGSNSKDIFSVQESVPETVQSHVRNFEINL